MMKTIILTASLIVNALVAYVFFNPVGFPGPKMSCDQSRSEDLSKQAAATFASENGGSFFKLHSYLRSSDFQIRNISNEDGSTTFVYTATMYPSSCGSLLPGIDGTIVRVKTNLAAEPSVVTVY